MPRKVRQPPPIACPRPTCRSTHTHVYGTTFIDNRVILQRKRECLKCGLKWRTSQALEQFDGLCKMR